MHTMFHLDLGLSDFQLAFGMYLVRISVGTSLFWLNFFMFIPRPSSRMTVSWNRQGLHSPQSFNDHWNRSSSYISRSRIAAAVGTSSLNNLRCIHIEVNENSWICWNVNKRRHTTRNHNACFYFLVRQKKGFAKYEWRAGFSGMAFVEFSNYRCYTDADTQRRNLFHWVM
jgi:hypothetical protein